MTKIYKISICFLILLAAGSLASAQQLRETFRRVKTSVVIVRTGGETAPVSGYTDDQGVGSSADLEGWTDPHRRSRSSEWTINHHRICRWAEIEGAGGGVVRFRGPRATESRPCS